MEHLDNNIKPEMSARAVACMLAAACNDLYADKPGNDTTVAAVRIRQRMDVNIMVGPPVDKEKDDYYIQHFLEGHSKKIVCGGTSSMIVARYLKTELKTSFDFPDKEVPPIGYIKGIDLTTEGVLTLRKLLQLSEKYVSIDDLTPKAGRSVAFGGLSLREGHPHHLLRRAKCQRGASRPSHRHHNETEAGGKAHRKFAQDG